MGNEKKVIAVITEGPSDEAALGTILKEFFSDEKVRFAVVHGDITTSDDSALDNIIIRIKELIDILNKRYGYQTKDYLRIIHIVDTDGVFTQDMIVETEIPKIRYYTDRMETSNAAVLERRNKKKSEILLKLKSTGKINGIKYRIYFNSCNLEHVLYDELKDFSDEEKKNMSDDFAEQYEGKVQEFINYISQETVAVKGTYNQTWDFIRKGAHSLHRHSNMHLIFERIGS